MSNNGNYRAPRCNAASASKSKLKSVKCFGFMVVLLVALPFMFGCSGTGPSRSMLTMMTDLVDTEESLDRIWPGYFPSTRHFAVYREGQDVLLVSGESEVEGFEKLENRWLKNKAWYSPTPPNTLRGVYALASELGGMSVTAVREDLDLVTMIHEDFHSFQSENWDVERESRLDVFNESNAKELSIGFDLETKAIMKAWRSNGETQKELLLDYLALRYVRENRMPENQIKVERRFELIEGTATYVGVRAASILGSMPGQRIRWLQDNLVRTNADTMQMLVRKRSYGIGLMLSMMLDTWADSCNWKLRASEEGAALSALLAEALGIDSGDLEARGTELLSKYRFEHKLEREQRRRPNYQPAIDLSRYLWQLSFVFVTQLDEDSGGQSGSFSFRRGGIHQLADGWTLVPTPESYNVQFAGQNLQVNRHPVIFRKEENEDQVISELVVLLRRPPRMRSGHLDPGEHMLSGQPFRQRGIILDADEPVKVDLQLIEELDASDFPWIDLDS